MTSKPVGPAIVLVLQALNLVRERSDIQRELRVAGSSELPPSFDGRLQSWLQCVNLVPGRSPRRPRLAPILGSVASRSKRLLHGHTIEAGPALSCVELATSPPLDVVPFLAQPGEAPPATRQIGGDVVWHHRNDCIPLSP